MVAGLADVEVLTDAHDRDQAVPECRRGLRRHQRVVLVVIRPAFGVPDDDERAAKFGQERTTDLARVGARIVLREVLCTVGQPQLVAVDQGLHTAQVGERRDDGDVDLVEVLVGQRERDLLDKGDGLEMIEVHLPVARDQRFTGHTTPN